jgi:hypothetical protein
MLVPPFRLRHAPAGRADTPVMGLGRTSSYQVTSPSGRVHVHAALPYKSTDPGMTPTVRAVQG